jgi:DNA-binding XRE family transcriptional regulator
MTDQELEVAARVHAAIDELTRLGPKATARVLMWIFDRYGIKPAGFLTAWEVRDRRTAQPITPAPEPPVAPGANGHEAVTPPLSEPTEREIRGAQLRERRLEAGLSQKQLAQHVGLVQANISSIELGRSVVSEDRWALLWKAVEIK